MPRRFLEKNIPYPACRFIQPPVPQNMKAKQKPLQIIPVAEFGVADLDSRVSTLKVMPPPPRKAGIKVGSVKELVQKLKYEAKVIA